ncbi:exported hypothetical protein [Pseudomonas sp. IT-P4]
MPKATRPGRWRCCAVACMTRVVTMPISVAALSAVSASSVRHSMCCASNTRRAARSTGCRCGSRGMRRSCRGLWRRWERHWFKDRIGLIAGTPAPTGAALDTNVVYDPDPLWERACSRRARHSPGLDKQA